VAGARRIRGAQGAAFLSREAYSIGVADLDPRLYQAIRRFIDAVQVVESELIPTSALRQPLRGVYEDYLDLLGRHRLLTYGQFIAHAVAALGREDIADKVHSDLQHLVVDEYQDINPAQEVLITQLVAGGAHLCVVGDDQQCVYQWRGSTVGNILTFDDRYPGAAQFRIETNRRSRPSIIETADGFATSISERLEKTMKPHRPAADSGAEVTAWRAATRAHEAAVIAESIRGAHDLHDYGWSDIAILCRTKALFPDLLDALDAAGIPVQPGGRTGLFDRPEAELFGRTICWLAGFDWRTSRYGWNTEPVELDQLVNGYLDVFALSADRLRRLRRFLVGWRAAVDDDRRPADLVGQYLRLIRIVGVETWDLDDAYVVNRLGTLARCSQVLADYEQAARRSRPDPATPGGQRGGSRSQVLRVAWPLRAELGAGRV
jgi:DNA helicase-2/ATP-dependent DNA helicase PcrA